MTARLRALIVILAFLPVIQGWGAAPPASEIAAGETAPAPPKRRGVVTAGVLNVRARPGLRFEVIAKLRKDAAVTVVAEEGDWIGIVPPKNAKAYVAARFLEADGTVTGDTVRVRSGPGLVFTPYARVHRDDRLELQGAPENGWQRITPPSTAVGWVHRDFVAIEPPPTPEVAAEQEDQPKAVAVAIAESATADQAETGEDVAPAATQPAAEADARAGKTDAGGETAEAGEKSQEKGPETAEAGPDGQGKPESEEKPAETTPHAAETGGELAAEQAPPATAEGESAAPEVLPPVRVSREGVVVSLGEQATDYVSHTLSRRVGATLYPVCYLNCRSREIDLSEWEGKQVKVYGREIRYPGWSRPVIEVDGIQLVEP
ncbi:MAG: SH3 domain-containing protein [Kiritimatiellaeota bacterium]|nr:SH3 domain-containing protein [Kiritimatiellota bacterium]